MFGPVTITSRDVVPSSAVSFGTNASRFIRSSTTGCRPSRISSPSEASTSGFTYRFTDAVSASPASASTVATASADA